MSEVSQGKLPCPVCPSSDAYFLYDDGHGHCFSCSYHYLPNRNLDLSEYTYEYLSHRGIKESSFIQYGCKTKIDKEGKPVAVGFQYPNGDYKVRLLDKKDFYWEKKEGSDGKTGLFGRDKFAAGSHKCVTITEGEYDAISLWQATHHPVVSVQSSSTALRDCTVDLDWLNSFESVYLAFDNDAAGSEAARKVARLFDYNKLRQVKFSNRKDANDYLQHGEETELRNIWQNSGKYLPQDVTSSLSDFKKALLEDSPIGFPYPFPTLNEMCGGIRPGEVVLITAQEGVGKTEIMHAIEYKLLKEQEHAVGAIFLEEPKRNHLEALVGMELRKPIHIQGVPCTKDEKISALERIVQADGRLVHYSHFDSDDPELLLDTVRFLGAACVCRYILLDHITMAVSGLAGEADERRALDYLSARLQMMAQELDFALIMVSHVNDYGQTRGSRYISKVAHIRIDAERDVLSNDPIIKNQIALTISKNRPMRKTGPAGILFFDEQLNTLVEQRGFRDAANDSVPQQERQEVS